MQKILSRIIIIILALWLIGYGANPLLVQAAVGTIYLSPPSGVTGTTVTVTGSGFSTNETPITFYYDSTVVATAPSVPSANISGGLSGITLVVPASPSGPHTIVASGPNNSANTTFTVTPGISVSPSSGAPGTTITVTGSGFSANETAIKVTYDGTAVATTPSAPSTNSQGGWSATFVVAVSPSGSYNIGASGSTTSAGSVSNKTFTVTPCISTNSPSAAPGSSVTITGSGFGASETGIAITYDSTVVASGISANYQGGWSRTFVVPASPSSCHIIEAYGYSKMSDTSNVAYEIYFTDYKIPR